MWRQTCEEIMLKIQRWEQRENCIWPCITHPFVARLCKMPLRFPTGYNSLILPVREVTDFLLMLPLWETPWGIKFSPGQFNTKELGRLKGVLRKTTYYRKYHRIRGLKGTQKGHLIFQPASGMIAFKPLNVLWERKLF